MRLEATSWPRSGVQSSSRQVRRACRPLLDVSPVFFDLSIAFLDVQAR